jgi:threonine/homoserine/homoserine lactone efflux protein
MDAHLFLSLMSYSFLMSITPGPNNVMLLSSGLLFGIRRTVPHLLGIPVGVMIQVWLTGAGLGAVFALEPRLQIALKIIGSIYLLWLASKLWHSGQLKETAHARPITFAQALLFQFVNPKAWLGSITAIAAFAGVGHDYAWRVLQMGLVFALVCVPCILIWAGGGAILRNYLQNPALLRLMNRTMAGLAALTAGLFWL